MLNLSTMILDISRANILDAERVDYEVYNTFYTFLKHQEKLNAPSYFNILTAIKFTSLNNYKPLL